MIKYVNRPLLEKTNLQKKNFVSINRQINNWIVYEKKS